jgi:hypothetical protein
MQKTNNVAPMFADSPAESQQLQVNSSPLELPIEELAGLRI